MTKETYVQGFSQRESRLFKTVGRIAPTWASLRSLGNSRIVQTAVIFPAIGYLILWNDQLHSLLSYGRLDRASPSDGAIEWIWSRKLHFLYFGLMSLGIGSAIYSWLCPFIIKKHGDYSDYIREDGPTLSTFTIKRMGELFGFPVGPAGEVAMNNMKPEILRHWYADQSRDKPIARLITFVMFALGLFF
ncbi:MAG: hypothetical protein WBF99_12335 [Xanthobacteraceae bacterium]